MKILHIEHDGDNLYMLKMPRAEERPGFAVGVP
jgi:hypothetical protein